MASLPEDSCLRVLWTKLTGSFKNVRFLKGGFNEFHRNYNALCTNKAQMLQNRQKKPTMEALSQPCLPNLGPTRILPFLYLGSQVDAMNQELLKVGDWKFWSFLPNFLANFLINFSKPIQRR